jgi:hypothetical protein
MQFANLSITFYDFAPANYVAAQLPRHCNMITGSFNKNRTNVFSQLSDFYWIKSNFMPIMQLSN